MAAAKFLSQNGLTHLWSILKQTFVLISDGTTYITAKEMRINGEDLEGEDEEIVIACSGKPALQIDGQSQTKEHCKMMLDKDGIALSCEGKFATITKSNIDNLAACLASGPGTGSADVTELSNSEIDAILAL